MSKPLSINSWYGSTAKPPQSKTSPIMYNPRGDRIVENPVLDIEFSKEEMKKLLEASDYTNMAFLKKIGQSYYVGLTDNGEAHVHEMTS